MRRRVMTAGLGLRILGGGGLLILMCAAFTPLPNWLNAWMAGSPRLEPADAIVVLGRGGADSDHVLTNRSLRRLMRRSRASTETGWRRSSCCPGRARRRGHGPLSREGSECPRKRSSRSDLRAPLVRKRARSAGDCSRAGSDASSWWEIPSTCPGRAP